MNAAFKTYAVFDLDGTLTRRDTYLDYLVSYWLKHPKQWLKGIPLGLYAAAYFCRLKDNTWLKQRFLATLFAGCSREELVAWNQQFIEHTLADNMRLKAKGTLALHKEAGHECVLLSASLDLYVQELAKQMGFSQCLSTKVQWQDGVLTGQLDGENLKGEQKVFALRAFLDRQDHKDANIIAYGDHASDFPLLKSADQGVLISENPRLQQQAKAAGLQVQQW